MASCCFDGWGSLGRCLRDSIAWEAQRGLMGPVVLLTLGIQFLLESMGVIRFGRTLPLLLIVIGLVKIFESSADRDRLMARLPRRVECRRRAS